MFRLAAPGQSVIRRKSWSFLLWYQCDRADADKASMVARPPSLPRRTGGRLRVQGVWATMPTARSSKYLTDILDASRVIFAHRFHSANHLPERDASQGKCQ